MVIRKSANTAENEVKDVNIQFLEKNPTIVIKLTSNQNNTDGKMLFLPMN